MLCIRQAMDARQTQSADPRVGNGEGIRASLEAQSNAGLRAQIKTVMAMIETLEDLLHTLILQLAFRRGR